MVKFLLNRPISVTMSVLAFVILGAVVSVRLPVSMMPPVDIPEILIKVEYPNYTAVEMEKNIFRLAQTIALSGMQYYFAEKGTA